MNDQLISYIKQRLVQHASDNDIANELLGAGWKKEDVDNAFVTIRGNQFQSPSIEPNAARSVSEPVTLNTSSDTFSTATTNVEALPGVFALLKGGLDIYKDRMGVLISIGAVSAGIYFLFDLLILISVGGLSTSSIITFIHSATLMTQITTVLVISLAGIVVLLFWYWIALAFMQAVCGHKEKIGFSASFSSTRHLWRSFVWLVAVGSLVGLGGIFLMSVLPSAILSLLGFVSTLALIIPGIYLIVSLAILVPLFSTWFVFSGWTFLTESLRGINALTASRELVRGRFWKIFGRMFWVLFIIGFVSFLVKLIFAFILVFIPMAGGIVFELINYLFFIPLSFAVAYFLYERVRLQVPNIPTSSIRLSKTFIAYAIIGTIGVIVTFLVLSFIVLASMNIARQSGNDAITKASLSTVLAQGMLDYPNYGSMTSVAKVPATALVWTGKPGAASTLLFSSSVNATNADSSAAHTLQEAYKNASNHDVYYFANKNLFFAAAKLTEGKYFCVDSSGYQGIVATVPSTSGSCKK